MLRKRRPTPATLFLLNDQTSPDDDRDGEHGEGAEGRLGHSPRKGGHHSSYTPPTMSQMQTLVELHLHATEEEDEEDLEDDDDDRSAGGEDDNGASGGDGHPGSLVLHVPSGPLAPHGEKGGARGGLQGDAGEPTPGTTAEPEAGSPPSGGAQGDSVGASGGGFGEGKEPGIAEEVANVTFEPRRRVTWAHGPGEAAGGPPHLASPPIPTGDTIGVPEAAATTTEPDAGAKPPSVAPGPRQDESHVSHVTHVTHADAQRAVEGCSRSDSEPGAGQDGEAGALAGTDADERSAGGPDGQPRIKAHVQFVGSAAEAGIQFDVRSAAKPDAESATEPGAQSGAHVDAHVVTEVGTGPTVN
ncbi:collagen alpha-1(I) chain-like isoform X2 [Lethenteron reissneri]|uniref:collagen alpha-1(I) chain-like isoform X2 n=1 Tax=Lethenteron reissneri TaxID=7753 RepID=UPI002AB79874|nr:collagen alpha-1(I) chain-like isoform X2 [Lethenteron reissneri]